MESIKKFQDLVKRLFQFETSDLDFGIYRILNYKRDRIEKFIQEDLKNKVESAFAKHKDERLTNISQRFEEAKQKVIQGLGTQAFTPTGELKEDFKDTPLGRDFLSIKAQKDEAETIDEIKLQVFNDLYNFFSRYYEEGDFVPQYRHSIKGHKYAIPYNGEEVKLYWANNEQYYTKTGLLYRDYTFKANEFKVIFRIVSAREELGSKKATKARFFILDDENPIKAEDKDLIIRFRYRELTEEEVRSCGVEGGSNTAKQEKINQKTYDEVLKKIKDIELSAPLAKDYKSEKPLLLYQISRFTAKHTKDYFIHKNLKNFLSGQLDYFIKAEVLDIETLEKERFLDKHITRAKVVREIGKDIIDFLSQIENFQKRLWEKKKFVLKTEYVITTDLLSGEFHQVIWANKDQKKEWKDLGFEIPKAKEDLKKRTLPIDTKHFSQEFREKLLEKLTENADLDDLFDGLLIKSENWQALNLLLARYKERVKCIYIDPPYNTGSDEFLYRDKYQHSSWISMMADRLEAVRVWLQQDGVLYVSIDDNEMHKLRDLMDLLFGWDNRLADLIWDLGTGTTAGHYRRSHEYILSYSKSKNNLPNFGGGEGLIRHGALKKPSIKNPPSKISFPAGMDYEGKDAVFEGEIGGSEVMRIDGKMVFEDGKLKSPVTIEAGWAMKKQIISWLEDKPTYDSKGQKVLGFFFNSKGILWYEKQRGTINPKTVLSKIASTKQGSDILKHFFGTLLEVDFPKPVELLCFLIGLTVPESEAGGIVLDFFAGSGTTTHALMKLNKEDGGRRKYILVEMADYFDTIIIPRLKKVCYSFNWKGGKPEDEDGISQFVKYHILEQYEDTLDNIELTSNETAQSLFKDDYLLKYFLDYETRENPSLLNIGQLKNPFSYKLKVNLKEVGEPQDMIVDMPETFNYLLGLKVKKIKARNKERKYLFVLGEKEGKDIAIVWREYDDDWAEDEFKEDKEFISKELEPWTPHIVYVNGQNILTPKLGKHTVDIRYIEPEFKDLMK